MLQAHAHIQSRTPCRIKHIKLIQNIYCLLHIYALQKYAGGGEQNFPFTFYFCMCI